MQTNDAQVAAIVAHLRSKYAMRITENEGARLLAAVFVQGHEGIEVRGRSAAYGIPQVILIFRNEVLAVLGNGQGKRNRKGETQ